MNQERNGRERVLEVKLLKSMMYQSPKGMKLGSVGEVIFLPESLAYDFIREKWVMPACLSERVRCLALADGTLPDPEENIEIMKGEEYDIRSTLAARWILRGGLLEQISGDDSWLPSRGQISRELYVKEEES